LREDPYIDGLAEVGKLIRGIPAAPDPNELKEVTSLSSSPSKKPFLVTTSKLKTVLAEAENESRSLRQLENDIFLQASKSFRGYQNGSSPTHQTSALKFKHANVRSPSTVRPSE
jgi:hypothetical protein